MNGMILNQILEQWGRKSGLPLKMHAGVIEQLVAAFSRFSLKLASEGWGERVER